MPINGTKGVFLGLGGGKLHYLAKFSYRPRKLLQWLPSSHSSSSNDYDGEKRI